MDASMPMPARPPTSPATTLDRANKAAHLRAGPLGSAGGSPIEALGSAA